MNDAANDKAPLTLPPVLVSACLGGRHCRYDGTDRLHSSLLKQLDNRLIIYYCPEEEGGLTTPRERATIDGGTGAEVLAGNARVLTESGIDVTAEFLGGARGALQKINEHGITQAYLKSNSPSCGCGTISRLGKKVAGNGVTAELLQQNGVEVQSVDTK